MQNNYIKKHHTKNMDCFNAYISSDQTGCSEGFYNIVTQDGGKHNKVPIIPDGKGKKFNVGDAVIIGKIAKDDNKLFIIAVNPALSKKKREVIYNDSWVAYKQNTLRTAKGYYEFFTKGDKTKTIWQTSYDFQKETILTGLEGDIVSNLIVLTDINQNYDSVYFANRTHIFKYDSYNDGWTAIALPVTTYSSDQINRIQLFWVNNTIIVYRMGLYPYIDYTYWWIEATWNYYNSNLTPSILPTDSFIWSVPVPTDMYGFAHTQYAQIMTFLNDDFLRAKGFKNKTYLLGSHSYSNGSEKENFRINSFLGDTFPYVQTQINSKYLQIENIKLDNSYGYISWYDSSIHTSMLNYTLIKPFYSTIPLLLNDFIFYTYKSSFNIIPVQLKIDYETTKPSGLVLIELDNEYCITPPYNVGSQIAYPTYIFKDELYYINPANHISGRFTWGQMDTGGFYPDSSFITVLGTTINHLYDPRETLLNISGNAGVDARDSSATTSVYPDFSSASPSSYGHVHRHYNNKNLNYSVINDFINKDKNQAFESEFYKAEGYQILSSFYKESLLGDIGEENIYFVVAQQKSGLYDTEADPTYIYNTCWDQYTGIQSPCPNCAGESDGIYINPSKILYNSFLYVYQYSISDNIITLYKTIDLQDLVNLANINYKNKIIFFETIIEDNTDINNIIYYQPVGIATVFQYTEGGYVKDGLRINIYYVNILSGTISNRKFSYDIPYGFSSLIDSNTSIISKRCVSDSKGNFIFSDYNKFYRISSGIKTTITMEVWNEGTSPAGYGAGIITEITIQPDTLVNEEAVFCINLNGELQWKKYNCCYDMAIGKYGFYTVCPNKGDNKMQFYKF